MNFRRSGRSPATGQPRWTQWFEMIVKLGTCFFVLGSATVPLLRMKAVRRLTSPWAGSTTKVATYHCVAREVRERAEVDLVLLLAEETREEREAGDGHGDHAADHAAEAERRALEEAAAGDRGGPWAARGRLPAARSGAARASRSALDRYRLRAQLGGRLAGPEEAEDDGDRTADRRDQLGLITSPTRTTTMPIAKPIGHSVGGGR